MKDKICIVTGANSGVGKETAKQLAELDAQVIMVVRNAEKGQLALEEIKAETGKTSLDLMICDFASQKSIRDFVEKFREKYDRLDILVNNHGVMPSKKHLTEDGLESTFAINHLGYFLLTNLLLDLIKASSPARILNVCSGSYGAVRKNRLDDYNFVKRRFSWFKAYSESKLYNVMFTLDLADRLRNLDVTVNTFTPGFTLTNLGQSLRSMRLITKLRSRKAASPSDAAKIAVYFATSQEMEDVSGKYYMKMEMKETTEIARDKKLQKELWDLSEKLTNIT
ncbi:MAG: SDR family NAD(P)-dependent oxidoreductase [Candidatus Heimdallarchaeota archaeon]|nr:SDR family NAD(P)-dependent oxidoreductase [Candidatus Heimdallarchaeota archaeon]MBY8993376.1 SDR family NAD(P)-dependent oxidoreductase [Candidatus Heimdallarchaeota archaeon]